MKQQIGKLQLNKKTILNLRSEENIHANNYTKGHCNSPSDTGCGTNQGHTCKAQNTCNYYSCRCSRKC
ncbi:MAG TPA: hypothetical protein VF476_10305 [Chitinophagaceae bacterium]